MTELVSKVLDLSLRSFRDSEKKYYDNLKDIVDEYCDMVALEFTQIQIQKILTELNVLVLDIQTQYFDEFKKISNDYTQLFSFYLYNQILNNPDFDYCEYFNLVI